MLKFKYSPTLLSDYGEEFYHDVLKVLRDPTNQAYIEAAQWEKLFDRVDRVVYQEENSALLSMVVELLSQAGLNFLPYVSKLPDYFLSDSNIESAVIPGNVKEIGNQAFAQCEYLTSTVIEEGCRVLGSGVFGHCPQLRVVELPGSLRYIGYAIFDGCSNLQKVIYKGPKHFFIQLVDDFNHRAAVSPLLGDVSLTIHCTNGDLLYRDNSLR